MEDILKQGMKEMLEMVEASTARIEASLKSSWLIASWKVETDSSEEQPKEKNGNESTEKKVEEEESKPENGVSGGKEVEKLELVEEERNDHEEKKEDKVKSKPENGVFGGKEVEKGELVEEERNGQEEKKEDKVKSKAENGVCEEKVEQAKPMGEEEKETSVKERSKELETTDVAEHGEAKGEEETEKTEIIKESPVGKTKSKSERPLDPELMGDQQIAWSTGGGLGVGQENYVWKVCLNRNCRWGLLLGLPNSKTSEGVLGITNVMFPMKLILTFDPGLL